MGNKDNCTICKGDRSGNYNISVLCGCPTGYYDDFINLNCSKCPVNCITCILGGCLTCKGNMRVSI